jgi:uncharacterized protein (UPF0303 family)
MNILEKLLHQEETLQFSTFSSETAWDIGKMFVEKGQAEKLSVTIDITLNRHQLFHYSFPGTSADNDEWVKRKVNLVSRFGHSSFYMGQKLKKSGKSVEEAFLIPESDFGAHGGCFPIILKGTGPVGTSTVTGLAQEDDHQLVVDVLEEYLKL